MLTNKTAPSVVIATKSTVTTVTVDNNLYHVYVYDNGTYTDITVRNTRGWAVPSNSDLYKDAIVEYNKTK